MSDPHTALSEGLLHGLTALSIDLPATTQASLLHYLALLARWNKAYNLTAVDHPPDMVIKHLLDSLAVLPHLPPGRIVDVGSGAGLPAVPIALAHRERSVSALDSNQKKVRFIQQAILDLGIPNLTAIHGRAEAYQPTEHYNVVIARAFASLTDFVTATAGLLATGGCWVAMKGVYPAAELAALPAVCTLQEVIPLHVPGLNAERHLVILQQAKYDANPR